MSEDLPLVSALVPPRIVGVAIVTLPLALRGRLRVERAAAPFLALTAACEIGGFTCFALGRARASRSRPCSRRCSRRSRRWART